MQKKVLLLGCGGYARTAHLPVLSAYRSTASPVAVMVHPAHVNSTAGVLAEFGLAPPVVEGHPISMAGKTYDARLEATLSRLDGLISDYKPDGAIVSMISAYNFPIALRCLRRGLHVLVEKPATCPPWCSSHESEARKIFPQMQELVETARQTGVRLLVGAQRRYELVYKWAHGRGPFEIILASHARGWGSKAVKPPINDEHWRRNPELTGGKIMHSGYHVIDIVAWLAMKTNSRIKAAKVFAMFHRFRYPQFLNRGCGYPENENIEKTAAVQIEFYEDRELKETACLATFVMTLGGPHKWTRESYLMVNQNQGKIIIERDLPAPGSPDPPNITQQLDDAKGVDQTIKVPNAAPGNRYPTEDFIKGIVNGRPSQEVSAGFDHLHSAKLVQAAYLSAIRGRVEEVSFENGS